MTSVYDQHSAHFSNVSAYVIARKGERVATIAFAHPRGAARLYAYTHWIGRRMVRGAAGGGGYDKHSAAAADAARKLDTALLGSDAESDGFDAFRVALASDDGTGWERALRKAGFDVLQAV